MAKHSISTLVALQFAKDHNGEYFYWHAGGGLKAGDLPDVALSAMNSDAIGQVALLNSGYQQFNSQAMENAGGLLSVALAYSALSDGELPLGNTGIWALFNDLNDLGEVLFDGRVSTLLKYEPLNFFGMFDRKLLNTQFADRLFSSPPSMQVHWRSMLSRRQAMAM